MQDLVERFSKPGELIVDLFSGTFAIAETCLKVRRPHRCVSCKDNDDHFAAITEVLFETYAIKVLEEKLQISGIPEMVCAYNTVSPALAGLLTRTCMRS